LNFDSIEDTDRNKYNDKKEAREGGKVAADNAFITFIDKLNELSFGENGVSEIQATIFPHYGLIET
jgi:hypothetical protein